MNESLWDLHDVSSNLLYKHVGVQERPEHSPTLQSFQRADQITSAVTATRIDFPQKKPIKLKTTFPKTKASFKFEVGTCILSPFEDRGDFVSLGGVTLGSDGSCAHTHRALIGLDPTEKGCGCASTVCHLCIGVVRLHREKTKLNASLTFG